MIAPFHIIIPARFQSQRFPGKLLEKIGDKSVLQHVYEQAEKSKPYSIIIATDNAKVEACARSFGAEVVLTKSCHTSGTDRIAEAVLKLDYIKDSDIIVNVQGDEPFISESSIKLAAQLLIDSDADLSTLCWPLSSLKEAQSSHVVKVIRGAQKQALCFSRSVIPYPRFEQEWQGLRHIGLYAYKAHFLKNYPNLLPCMAEQTEGLEQLRALHYGYKIIVGDAISPPLQDINTPEDLEQARLIYQKKLAKLF